jgi:hypothetical protein
MRIRNYLSQISSMLAATLLALSLMAAPGRSGETTQTFKGEVTDSICAKSGSHEEMMAKMPRMGRDKATCTKQCAELGAKYVLYDQENEKLYNLDDQAKVSTFAGQRVRIAGTLDGNNIIVRDIETIG